MTSIQGEHYGPINSSSCWIIMWAGEKLLPLCHYSTYLSYWKSPFLHYAMLVLVLGPKGLLASTLGICKRVLGILTKLHFPTFVVTVLFERQPAITSCCCHQSNEVRQELVFIQPRREVQNGLKRDWNTPNSFCSTPWQIGVCKAQIKVDRIHYTYTRWYG